MYQNHKIDPFYPKLLSRIVSSSWGFASQVTSNFENREKLLNQFYEEYSLLDMLVLIDLETPPQESNKIKQVFSLLIKESKFSKFFYNCCSKNFYFLKHLFNEKNPDVSIFFENCQNVEFDPFSECENVFYYKGLVVNKIIQNGLATVFPDSKFPEIMIVISHILYSKKYLLFLKEIEKIFQDFCMIDHQMFFAGQNIFELFFYQVL